jgi:hypothetical protein
MDVPKVIVPRGWNRAEPELMRVLPLAEEFAAEHEAEAQAVDHCGRYREVKWTTAELWRTLLVFSRREHTVDVSAVAITRDSKRPRSEATRSLGTVSVSAPSWAADLTGAFRAGLEWLDGLNDAAIRQWAEAGRRLIDEQILPTIRQFAAEQGIEVLHAYESNCVLVWPRGNPRWHLGVSYVLPGGVAFVASVKATRGAVRKKQTWVLCEKSLADLDSDAWPGVQCMLHRLHEAKRRVEACVPSHDAPETWVG